MAQFIFEQCTFMGSRQTGVDEDECAEGQAGGGGSRKGAHDLAANVRVWLSLYFLLSLKSHWRVLNLRVTRSGQGF